MKKRVRRAIRWLFRMDRKTVREVACAIVLERMDPMAMPDMRQAIEVALRAGRSWNPDTERELNRWVREYEDSRPKPARAGGWVW